MTTKKEKREHTSNKRAVFDAETKRLGLVAQKRDREKVNDRYKTIIQNAQLPNGKDNISE